MNPLWLSGKPDGSQNTPDLFPLNFLNEPIVVKKNAKP